MLKNLSLENFRNYKKFSLDFSKTTILVGPNGVGKTNILESIYLLSAGRSWRTKRDNEAIKWDADFLRIQTKIKNNKETDIEMIIQKNSSSSYPRLKMLKINGVKRGLVELLGKIPSVLFSPEALALVEGAPTLRRRFLDLTACQVHKQYAFLLLEYYKILKNRNKLLFFLKNNQAQENELDFWDEKLAEKGIEIVKVRKKLIKILNINLSGHYRQISGQDENLALRYRATAPEENFGEFVFAHREQEIAATATLFGPHRDDFIFLLGGRNLATFGSRGEYRSAVLAAKLAELDYLESSNEIKPILLLDDIFSELDEKRRGHLSQIIAGKQVIITTTDLDHIEKGLIKKAKVVELK